MAEKSAVRCEIYSRVSGYYRPVNQYNAGKREEYFERKKIKVPEGLNGVQDRVLDFNSVG